MKLTLRFFSYFLLLLTLFLVGSLTLVHAAQVNQLKGVRAWPSPDSTRIVLDLSRKPDYNIQYLKYPDRVLVDLKSTVSQVNLTTLKNNGPLVKDLRESASGQKGTYRLVIDLNQASKASFFSLPPEKPYGHRLVLDLPHAEKVGPSDKKRPASTAVGRDIIIAVDAGHGGEDPGASGRYSHEKKVTLEIAKRLQKRINQQKGMHAFLIRTGDYFVNLNKRSAIARKKKADFLVSIHADGFTSSQPHGASVWVLSNRRATTELGRWMEKHEAHSELLGGAGNLIQDSSSVPFLTEMFLDMSMGNAMDVGYQVGDLVVNELGKVTQLHKQKPVHASLAVLKSPDIPSILVEAGFITNRREEKLLNLPRHQQKIANAIFKGLYENFTESPPQHTLFAQKKRAIKHTVRSGESLSILAARYSIPSQELQSYNNLQSNSLHIGQVIKIPANYRLVVTPDPVKQIDAAAEKVHIHNVKRGESLSQIAAKYGSTTGALKSYNQLHSSTLAIGQKLKIPGEPMMVAQRVAPKPVRRTQALVHNVKRGESLSQIAAKYGSTTGALKSYNQLHSSTLAIGQKLKIPGEPMMVAQRVAPKPVRRTQALVHNVKRGESLSQIAAKYGSTTGALKSYNQLHSSTLAIGQKLKIPGEPVMVAQRVAPKPVRRTQALVHNVKRGESLSQIAAKYGTTTSVLKKHNKLHTTLLRVGQKIKVPDTGIVTVQQVAAVEPIIYKVRSGESLSLIASRFGTTVKTLKQQNKLHSTSLQVGQKIKIPISVAQLTKHKVRSGESLSMIASRYGTTTDLLKSFNQLSSTSLLIGQVLTIPVT